MYHSHKLPGPPLMTTPAWSFQKEPWKFPCLRQMTPLICTPIVSQTVTEVAHGKMNKIAAQHKLELGWWESKYKDTEGNQKLRAHVPSCVWMGIGRGPGRGRKRLLLLQFLWGHKVFFHLFYWNIVGLQCFVNFYCTAKWFSYVCLYTYVCVYIYTFSYSFPVWLIRG